MGPNESGYESAPEPEPWTEVAVRADWFMAAGGGSDTVDRGRKVEYEELTVEENEAEAERMGSLAGELSAQTSQLSARVRFINGRRAPS